jgi:hypothetical protein
MKVKPQSPGSRGTATASTRSMGNQPGGGIGSKVVRREGTRDGQKAFPINPAAAAQLGGVYGNKATEQGSTLSYRGEPWTKGAPPISVPLGNELAKNVGKGGPGAGREVFKSGSQGTSSPTRSPNASGRSFDEKR